MTHAARYLAIVTADSDPPPAEPTDEDLWLEAVARRVEADARPLTVAAWLWLLRQALELDENDQ